MPSQHSVLGCSSAAQWIACPGSVEAQRLFREAHPELRDTNPAAEWGTSCHAVAEWFLQHPLAEVWEFDEETYEGLADAPAPFDEEMLEMAWAFRSYCLGLVADGAEFATELRVEVHRVNAVCFGTVDFMAIDFEHLHADLADLKTGRHAVYAEDNAQLQMYAEGVRAYVKAKYDLDLRTLTLRIFGPRFAEGISEWTISAEALDRFVGHANHQATIALSTGAPRVPGDKQCRWCRAEPHCKARSDQMLDLVAGEFPVLEGDEVEQLSTDERAAWVLRRDAIERFLGKVNEVARSEASGGAALPGLKLVAGSVRYKADPDEVEAILGDRAFEPPSPPKLKSLTRLRKELSAEEFALVSGLFERVEGQPLLVSESDARRAITLESVEDAFGKVG